MAEKHQVVIIGSGPAGLTAAIYAARAQLKPLVLVGDDLGGQISWTYDVENYPGFPDGISGQDLVERLRKQAERFGAELVYQSARDVDFSDRPFKIVTDSSELEAETVIIASGAHPRKLKVPGEDELTGKGVSYCSVCDGPFFKDKKVIVVGGGNSALDEGNYLTTFAEKVYLIHRREEFRAAPIYVNRAKENDKMEFVLNTVVTGINGENSVESVTLKDVDSGEEREMEIDGVFIYIGQIPNTEVYGDQIECDEKGFIVVDEDWQTSVEGVFAAGEVEDWKWKQMVSACGDACKAALSAQTFLETRDA